VHLVLDIFQGLGVAAAVGIRPFLPALLVGALGAGDIQVDFKGTDYSFLQSWPFLLAMFLAAVALAVLERRSAAAQGEGTPVAIVVGAAGLALGALLFAGALAQDHHASWPGLVAGVVCAGLGVLATRPLLGRVRSRLQGGDAAALPAYAEVLALLAALLSVLAPGVGVILVLALAWLLVAGRRREGQKYAGLRILR
jgi:hypothetical protein